MGSLDVNPWLLRQRPHSTSLTTHMSEMNPMAFEEAAECGRRPVEVEQSLVKPRFLHAIVVRVICCFGANVSSSKKES